MQVKVEFDILYLSDLQRKYLAKNVEVYNLN